MKKRIKNIFFDFDGVIAESVSAKTEAFREMYMPYGESIANQVVEHHIMHGGVSRFEKFKIYHEIHLNQKLTETDVAGLAQEFSDLVLEKVINSKEVFGANAFIKKYSGLLDFWVITGTPTPEINTIVRSRRLDPYFVGLHGSPENKKYWTEFLIDKHDLNREETLFLGDATTDYEAALYSKLNFGLREHDENIEIFKDYRGLRFKDFNELETLIKEYLP